MPIPEATIQQLLALDSRYGRGAYELVEDALRFAQLEQGIRRGRTNPHDCHLSGQQLCDAIRVLAQEQYGYMAKVVLNSWGLAGTSDIGEVVYNLITVGSLRKSQSDRREDFDDCYDFEEAFQRQFEITLTE